jgi:hypothetical protein
MELQPVAADRFCGAILHCLQGERGLIRSERLAVSDAETDFFVTLKRSGRGDAAQVAIDAGRIHVERPGDAANIFFILICHTCRVFHLSGIA